jgi:hypothetical protein
MKKKFFLFLSLIHLILTSCSIRGSYYILNKSKSDVKIQIRYSEFCDWQGEIEQIRIKEYQNEKIKILTYKEMHEPQITLDTNKTKTISFTLQENYIAYIGTGTNTHFTNIEDLKIIDLKSTTRITDKDIQIKSNGGGYVGIYNYK